MESAILLGRSGGVWQSLYCIHKVEVELDGNTAHFVAIQTRDQLERPDWSDLQLNANDY